MLFEAWRCIRLIESRDACSLLMCVCVCVYVCVLCSLRAIDRNPLAS